MPDVEVDGLEVGDRLSRREGSAPASLEERLTAMPFPRPVNFILPLYGRPTTVESCEETRCWVEQNPEKAAELRRMIDGTKSPYTPWARAFWLRRTARRPPRRRP